jgi:membrane-bound ClpP family serine protease
MKTFSAIELCRLWLGARRKKRETGVGFSIGARGVAETSLSPDGFVSIAGHVWAARASGSVARGSEVRVLGADDYRLTVEKIATNCTDDTDSEA